MHTDVLSAYMFVYCGHFWYSGGHAMFDFSETAGTQLWVSLKVLGIGPGSPEIDTSVLKC